MAFEEMEKEGKEKIEDAKILLAVLYKELNGGRSPSDDTMELIDKFIDQLTAGIMTMTSKAILSGMLETKSRRKEYGNPKSGGGGSATANGPCGGGGGPGMTTNGGHGGGKLGPKARTSGGYGGDQGYRINILYREEE